MKYLLSFCLLFNFCQNGFSVTWTGGTGNWNVPGNWDTGSVPTASDNVVIGFGNEVTIPSGFAAAAMTVENIGTLNVSANSVLNIGSNTGSYSGLDNNGTLNNWGTINIDDITTVSTLFTYGHGIYTNNLLDNKSSGIINISNTERDGIFVSGVSNFINAGTINLLSGIGGEGIDSYANSGGDIDNSGTINIQGTTDEAINLGNTSRVFSNSGTINIVDAGGDGISVLGTLENEAGGTITISQTGGDGIDVLTGGSFSNSGTLTLELGINYEGIHYRGTVINEPCGTINTEEDLVANSSFPGTFTNNGWIISTYEGTGTGTGFTNNGVIQDRYDSFVNVTNNKIITVEKSGTYCSGYAVSDFFDLGSLSGFSVTNNAFYLEQSLITSVGSFDPVNNTFTPNANAIGSKVFFVEFNDDANGCSKIFRVRFANNIIAPITFYEDSDDDGFGNAASTTSDCSASPPTGYVLDNTDCDDSDPLEFPTQTWYADLDDDGYTDGTSLVQCERPVGYKAVSELSGIDDCDDNDAEKFPGNPEVCDGKDNDCDGTIDDGVCIGNTCTTPNIISALPYVFSGTTQGAGDDYSNADACGSNWMDGEDVVFAFNANAGQVARIKLEMTNGPNGNSAPGVFVLDDCPDNAASCLYEAEAQNGTSTIYIETVHIQTSGTYYIVVSSHATFHDWFDFTLTVDLPSGNICENAQSISALPYSFTGSTRYLGDDYGSGDACNSNWMNGNDMVFQYNSSGNEVVRIKLELTASENANSAPAVFVLDDCPNNGGNCLFESIAQNGTSTIYIETVHFETAGVYYIVVASHSNFHDWFDFTLTIDLPLGNICENARSISSLPYSFSGSTQYCGDDYSSTSACTSNWMSGNDVVFQYNSPGSEVARIKLELTASENANSAPAVFVLDDCPDNSGNCLYNNTAQNGTSTIYIETVHFETAGVYYIVVSSYANFHQWYDFTLTIDSPSGNICENATPISSLPYSASNHTTCLLGDDYSSTGDCVTNYINGNDHVYRLSAGSSTSIDIQLSNLSDDNTSINFSDGFPNSGTSICTTMVNNGTNDYIFENLSLSAGTDYYITIASHSTFTDCFNYNIEVEFAGALPVDLINFSAKKINEKTVEINWETANEINLSHFEIERSEDGKIWENINSISANGTSNKNEFYTVKDEMKTVPKNQIYYRLLMVDLDGTIEHSPVRSVQFENELFGINIFPNPNNGQFQIEFPKNEEGYFELSIMNGTGRLIYSQNISVINNGKTAINEQLPKGMNFLLIRKNGKLVQRKKLMIF